MRKRAVIAETNMFMARIVHIQFSEDRSLQILSSVELNIIKEELKKKCGFELPSSTFVQNWIESCQLPVHFGTRHRTLIMVLQLDSL